MTETDLFAAARQAADSAGGFFLDLPHHVLCHIPAARNPLGRLVVSFDNLASRREERARMPWGHEVLGAQGWSVLGVMVKRPDWFRDPELWAAFDQLRDQGFFRQFAQVSMYGASMGGYGALAFAPAAPGCTVMAFAPQSSLNRALVPFETRYRFGRRLGDWRAATYSDAAEGLKAAGKVYVAYDPWEPLDKAHAARLTGPNVTPLQMRGVGHKIPPALKRMGLLKAVALEALTGTLTAPEFHRMFRARRDMPLWQANLLSKARHEGHLQLALRAADHCLRRQPHWRVRHERQQLTAALAAEAGRGNTPPAQISSDSDPT